MKAVMILPKLLWTSKDTQHKIQKQETNSKPCQKSKKERFPKIVNGRKPSTISAKCSILDILQDSEYASESNHCFI